MFISTKIKDVYFIFFKIKMIYNFIILNSLRRKEGTKKRREEKSLEVRVDMEYLM